MRFPRRLGDLAWPVGPSNPGLPSVWPGRRRRPDPPPAPPIGLAA